MEDMIKIKLAVEGMQAEIIKAFDVKAISSAIRSATEKVVAEFDIENYIASTVATVFARARDAAIDELQETYGDRWADEIRVLVDDKLRRALEA